MFIISGSSLTGVQQDMPSKTPRSLPFVVATEYFNTAQGTHPQAPLLPTSCFPPSLDSLFPHQHDLKSAECGCTVTGRLLFFILKMTASKSGCLLWIWQGPEASSRILERKMGKCGWGFSSTISFMICHSYAKGKQNLLTHSQVGYELQQAGG